MSAKSRICPQGRMPWVSFHFIFFPVAFGSLPVFIIRINLAFFRSLTNFLKDNAYIVRFHLNDTLGWRDNQGHSVCTRNCVSVRWLQGIETSKEVGGTDITSSHVQSSHPRNVAKHHQLPFLSPGQGPSGHRRWSNGKGEEGTEKEERGDLKMRGHKNATKVQPREHFKWGWVFIEGSYGYTAHPAGCFVSFNKHLCLLKKKIKRLEKRFSS